MATFDQITAALSALTVAHQRGTGQTCTMGDPVPAGQTHAEHLARVIVRTGWLPPQLLEALSALHHDDGAGKCAHCSLLGAAVTWPCPTAQAVGPFISVPTARYKPGDRYSALAMEAGRLVTWTRRDDSRWYPDGAGLPIVTDDTVDAAVRIAPGGLVRA